MTIREFLKELGATEAELSAKVVGRMENAMLFDTDIKQCAPDTVIALINDVCNGLAHRCTELANAMKTAQALGINLNAAITEAKNELHDLSEQTRFTKTVKVSDSKTRDAVLAYASVLNFTKDIFGEENMTESVMTSAIKAGSFMAWRSIMGAKDPETQETGWKKGRL